jgi:hypothetical protein
MEMRCDSCGHEWTDYEATPEDAQALLVLCLGCENRLWEVPDLSELDGILEALDGEESCGI